jgi:hypothetical protein
MVRTARTYSSQPSRSEPIVITVSSLTKWYGKRAAVPYETPEDLDLARPQLALIFSAYAGVAILVATVLLYRRGTK